MRVLVIEDDYKVANFIEKGLQQESYAVDVLRDGVAAGDQAVAIDYDAVVLDLMLPGRTGFQVLNDIRARKQSLPVTHAHREGVARRTDRWLGRRRRRLHGEAVRAGRAVGPPARTPSPWRPSRDRSSGLLISRSTLPRRIVRRAGLSSFHSSPRDTRSSSS